MATRAMTPQGGLATSDTGDWKRWPALGLLSLAQLMLILDVTVVNIALPDIGASLGLGRAALTWRLTAYTQAFGAMMLLRGRLADQIRSPRRLVAVLVLLTAALAVPDL